MSNAKKTSVSLVECLGHNVDKCMEWLQRADHATTSRLVSCLFNEGFLRVMDPASATRLRTKSSRSMLKRYVQDEGAEHGSGAASMVPSRTDHVPLYLRFGSGGATNEHALPVIYLTVVPIQRHSDINPSVAVTTYLDPRDIDVIALRNISQNSSDDGYGGTFESMAENIYVLACQALPTSIKMDPSLYDYIRRELFSSVMNQALTWKTWDQKALPSINSPTQAWETSVRAGHATHPMHRTRLGFTLEDVYAYGPEHDPTFTLRAVFLPRQLMHPTYDYEMRVWAILNGDPDQKDVLVAKTHQESIQIGRRIYERTMEAIRSYLRTIKDNTKLYQDLGHLLNTSMSSPLFPTSEEPPVFLVIHPGQVATLQRLFTEEAIPMLMVPEEVLHWPAKAKMSLRTILTLAPPTFHGEPPQAGQVNRNFSGVVFKMPINVRTTSALRTISPYSIHNGPRLRPLLQHILVTTNRYFGQDGDPLVDALFETASCGLRHANEAIAKQCGLLLRQNLPSGPSIQPRNHTTGLLTCQVQKGYTRRYIPCCALVEDGRDASSAIVLETFGLKTLEERVRFLAQYVDLLFRAFLPSLLLFGVAFEAHGQNTLLAVDVRDGDETNWVLRGFVTRDFGGIFIEAGMVQNAGATFPFHADSNPNHGAMEVLLRAHGIEDVFRVRAYVMPGSAILAETYEAVVDNFYHCVFQNHVHRLVRALSLHHPGGNCITSRDASSLHATFRRILLDPLATGNATGNAVYLIDDERVSIGWFIVRHVFQRTLDDMTKRVTIPPNVAKVVRDRCLCVKQVPLKAFLSMKMSNLYRDYLHSYVDNVLRTGVEMDEALSRWIANPMHSR